MSNNYINVHTYDGKLKNIFTPLKTYSLDEKREMFNDLITKLHPISALTVKIIVKDLDTVNGGANFQKENCIDASDILADIIHRTKIEDILPMLNEQLADAKNLGICPSGRVTRLLQLWRAFIY